LQDEHKKNKQANEYFAAGCCEEAGIVLPSIRNPDCHGIVALMHLSYRLSVD
jgi:hypothetical protein